MGTFRETRLSFRPFAAATPAPREEPSSTSSQRGLSQRARHRGEWGEGGRGKGRGKGTIVGNALIKLYLSSTSPVMIHVLLSLSLRFNNPGRAEQVRSKISQIS